jgi:hypothetical protein
MAKKSKTPTPFEGRWRITLMEMWAQDFVDAEVEGYFEFRPDGMGSFQFGYVSGEIDYRDGIRDGKRSVEWSWEGNDEMDPASGRGWAVQKVPCIFPFAFTWTLSLAACSSGRLLMQQHPPRKMAKGSQGRPDKRGRRLLRRALALPVRRTC